MPNDLIDINNAVLPAFINPKDTAISEAVLGGMSSGTEHPRLSIRAGRFRLVEGGVETPLQTLAVQVVIVGANPAKSKVFYSSAYDEDEASAPDCWSNDGMHPDPSVTTKQAESCATCPQNVWGSKITPTGKQTRACSDLKRIAVVDAENVESTVYELTVPASSHKDLTRHAKELAMKGVPLHAAVTQIGFDPQASYPKLTFSFAGFIRDDQYQKVQSLVGSDAIKEIVRALPSTPAPAALEAPAPTPVAAPEPKKEETPPAPAQPAASGLGAAKVEAPVAPAPAPDAPAGLSAAAPLSAAPSLANADMSAYEADIDSFLNASKGQ